MGRQLFKKVLTFLSHISMSCDHLLLKGQDSTEWQRERNIEYPPSLKPNLCQIAKVNNIDLYVGTVSEVFEYEPMPETSLFSMPSFSVATGTESQSVFKLMG